MGRLVDFLAGVLALARILVEGRQVWSDYRDRPAKTEPDGAGDRERPDQQEPPDPGAAGGP